MSTKNKQQKTRKRIFFGLYLSSIVLVMVLFSYVGYVAASIYPLLYGDLTGAEGKKDTTEQQQLAMENGQYTILLLGSDRRPDETKGRSDTLMVAYVDTVSNVVRVLSVPRDTYVAIDGHGHTKANHAYAYGGLDLTKQTLKDNFNIEIDYYADIDFQGFRDVIDAIGGIQIDVPVRMENAGEGIDLYPGLQQLDGDKALQFVRYRTDDLSRIERQQLFMTTMSQQFMSMNTMLKIPALSKAIVDNVRTDMTGSQMIGIMNALKDNNGMNFYTYQLPGEGRYQGGASYFFIYENQSAEMLDALNNYLPPVGEGVDETATDEAATDEAATDETTGEEPGV